MLADHLTSRTQRVRITLVDPSTRQLQGTLRDGASINITVWQVAASFVWPLVGEQWTVTRQSGVWILGQRMEAADGSHSIQDLEPGQAKIDANVVFDRRGMPIGVPIGVPMPWTRIVIPTGYVSANGQWLDAVDYPDAYEVALEEVDAGNPLWDVDTTNRHLQVPDLTDRFIYSAGSKALGDTGGQETVTLDVAHMPNHDHGGTTSTGTTGKMDANASHTHTTNMAQGIGSGGYDGNWIAMAGPSGGAAGTAYGGVVTKNTDHAHSVPGLTISPQGGGAPVDTMPPHIVLAWILKV